MAISRKQRVQIDPNGLARGSVDTFKALTVPFKSAPKLGPDNNYARLADALGAFSNSMGNLGSFGAMLAKKERENQVDAQVWAQRASFLQNADPDVRAKLAAQYGGDINSDWYHDIGTLTTKTIPDAAKSHDAELASESSKEHPWAVEERDQDGGVFYRPVTEEDVRRKWANLYGESVGGYSNNKVYTPQFRALMDHAVDRQEKELKALEEYRKNEILNKARDSAVNLAAGNAVTVSRMEGATGDKIWASIDAQARDAYSKAGGGPNIPADVRVQLNDGSLKKIIERAKAGDTEAAHILEKLADSRMDNGSEILNHKVYGSTLKAGLAVANATLGVEEFNAKVDAAKKLARASRGSYGQHIEDAIAHTRTDRFGNSHTETIAREKLLKLMAKEDDQRIRLEGTQLGKSADEIIREMVTNGEERGYTSSVIEEKFAGAMAPDDPQRVEEQLQLWRTIQRDAPASADKYVKTAQERNFFTALDLLSRNNVKGLDAATLAKRLIAGLDDKGRPRDVFTSLGPEEKFAKWEQTAGAQRLTAEERANAKQVFNMLYGAEELRTVKGTAFEKLDAIAQSIVAGSFEYNGKRVPLGSQFVEPGSSRVDFLKKLDEFTTDVLKSYAPGVNPKTVQIYPKIDGSGFVIADANGIPLTTNKNGKEQQLAVDYRVVGEFLKRKHQPETDAQQQRQNNKARQQALGEKPVEGPPKPKRPYTDNENNPFALPSLPKNTPKAPELPTQKTSGGRAKGQQTVNPNPGRKVLSIGQAIVNSDIMKGRGKNTNSNRKPRKTPKSRQYDITKPWLGLKK